MILFGSVQRIYFYEYSHSALHLMNTILPSLKHSLSLTLQHFFPLAGTLTFSPHPSKPHILYTAGDSISLTIAESTGNFTHLVSNYPRDVKEFSPLVPQLSSSTDAHKQVILIPSLALQLTIFPNFGISIGITYSHGAIDGRTSNHFMKSWASIFKSSQGDLSCIDDCKSILLPFYDRSVIKDSKGLDSNFWNQCWTWKSSSSAREDTTTTAAATVTSEDKFRATFILGRLDIERLKEWISRQCKDGNESEQLHLSTFVVTCAFIWVCLAKVKSQDSTMIFDFGFVADCRNRDKISVPVTYFGNCLTVCCVSAKREELVSEYGIIVAAKVIGSKVKELEGGVLQEADNWLSIIFGGLEFPHFVSVAGSPKLCLYETDFGWGRPRKIEVVHFDAWGPFSLAESRDEEGGIEVGLALAGVQMEAFTSIFEQGLKKFSTH